MSETLGGESATKSRGLATAKGGHDRMPTMPDASVFTFGPITGHATPLEPTTAPVPVAQDPPSPAPMSMFDRLVTAENDVVGLVAYGIYKYSKRDWAAAFEKANGREPDAREVASFTLGETTDRRAATYRHLAENMVAAAYAPRDGTVAANRKTRLSSTATPAETERSPYAAIPHAVQTGVRRTRGGGRNKPSLVVIVYLAVLILFLVGLVVMVRTGSMPFGMGRH